MNYLVTEPGLTYLSHAQRLTAQNYALAQQVFGSDAFVAVPYSRKLQQQMRNNPPSAYMCSFTQKSLTSLLTEDTGRYV